MSLANDCDDVVFREKIKHEVGDEAIGGGRGFRYGRRAVGENHLCPRTERGR